jgi:hypothetical protein
MEFVGITNKIFKNILQLVIVKPDRSKRKVRMTYNLLRCYRYMESVKEKVSKAADEFGNKGQENKSNWTQIVSQLVEKLTGKDLAITYQFDSLQVDIPKATGPDGKEIGSAKWKIDGKIIISTEVHDKAKSME